MILRITRCALLITVLLAGASFAVTYHATGNPTATSTGVNVVAYGTSETFNFQVNSVQMPAASQPSDETHTVTSEFGFSSYIAPTYLTVQPGNTVYQYVIITTESNATAVGRRLVMFRQYNGANNWLVNVLKSDYTVDKILDPTGAPTGGANPLPRSIDFTYIFQVIVPSSAADAPNGSYIIITNTLECFSTPYGEYTGANYYTYGGFGYQVTTLEDVVSSPILTLSRTSTVDAPLVYTGGIHDAVPGSIITYTLTYSNTADAAAENINIIAKVPQYANLTHVNKTGATDNVNIMAAAGSFTGSWEVWYSTFDNPDMSYGNIFGEWFDIGSLTSSGSFPAGALTYRGYTPTDSQYNAKWIKFERTGLGAGVVNQTVTWGVSIR